MKRFTETEKWRDPWFRKLSAGAKLAFLYILDNCDGAGVWSADKDLADFSIGMAVPWEKVSKDFADRLAILPDGKWLLTKFVEFQYGHLSPDCKPHLAVIRLIEKHKIKKVLKGYTKGINTLEEKEKDKEKDKERGSAEGDSETIYLAYPRREGKGEAIKAIGKALKKVDSKILMEAVAEFSTAHNSWIPEDRQYIPYPATWFNQERWNDDRSLWGKRSNGNGDHKPTAPRPKMI